MALPEVVDALTQLGAAAQNQRLAGHHLDDAGDGMRTAIGHVLDVHSPIVAAVGLGPEDPDQQSRNFSQS